MYIIAFHHDFESIHPFQDGNGRVGRLIALKECLHYGIVPFFIEDAKKAFYYRGLAEWENEKGYLIDTCLDGQDTFKRLLAMFDIDVEFFMVNIVLSSRGSLSAKSIYSNMCIVTLRLCANWQYY